MPAELGLGSLGYCPADLVIGGTCVDMVCAGVVRGHQERCLATAPELKTLMHLCKGYHQPFPIRSLVWQATEPNALPKCKLLRR